MLFYPQKSGVPGGFFVGLNGKEPAGDRQFFTIVQHFKFHLAIINYIKYNFGKKLPKMQNGKIRVASHGA